MLDTKHDDHHAWCQVALRYEAEVRYPAEQTAARHKRILEQACRLFKERGLDGVSVPEIMRAAKLTHGPFYNHFKSKDALVAECIDRTLGAQLKEVVAAKSSQAAHKRYLDDYLSAEHRDNPGEGCTLAALAVDVARNPAARDSFTRGLKEILAASGKSSDGSREGSRARAIRLLAQMVGAVILARAVDDSELSEEILAQTRAGL